MLVQGGSHKHICLGATDICERLEEALTVEQDEMCQHQGDSKALISSPSG